jgi:hypothetical protein
LVRQEALDARALLALVLSLCCACSVAGEASPAAAGRDPAISQVPGLAAAPSVNGLFRNLDPKYHRAGYVARLRSLVLGATWLVAEHPVVALPWCSGSRPCGATGATRR